jgi:hypothetical protein
MWPPRSTVLVNLGLVELERLGNFFWSGTVFGGAVPNRPLNV